MKEEIPLNLDRIAKISEDGIMFPLSSFVLLRMIDICETNFRSRNNSFPKITSSRFAAASFADGMSEFICYVFNERTIYPYLRVELASAIST